MSRFRASIQHAINCASAESGSDTPDFILAEYLTDCLAAYDRALVAREKWYGRTCGGIKGPTPIDAPPPEEKHNAELTRLLEVQKHEIERLEKMRDIIRSFMLRAVDLLTLAQENFFQQTGCYDAEIALLLKEWREA